jgi:hypothetical protein
MSNNLNLSQVAAAQNQKEVTINDQAGELDAALTEVLTVAVDDTNAVALTSSQFRRNFFFYVEPDTTPPDGAVTVTVPAIKRGLFKVRNSTAQSVTVTVSGQSLTAPEIAAGEAALLSCDGGDVQPEGSGEPGGGTDANAIHTNVAGEIAALTEKGSPAAGDHLLIEDSEDNNSKKRVRVANLPAGTQSYDFGFVKADSPTTNEVIGKVVIPRSITIPADMAGAAGHIDSNPTAQLDIAVTDDGASIGTISIATNGAFTFATDGGTAKQVAAGSVIRFVAPNTPDATAAGIAATLIATQD